MGPRAAPEAEQTSAALGRGHNFPSALPGMPQNAFANWSDESSSAGETGGALAGRPRQSRMARVALGG